jgi:type II secretory pathway component GspD/PulD (secretin)
MVHAPVPRGDNMKRYSFLTTLVFCLLIAPPHVAAQSSPGESESKTLPQAENGVPLDRLIATVAKKTGKKFVVDPRVHANAVLVGQEPSEVTYPQLLTVLEVYGYIAVDDGGYVRILPDANARQEPIPTITSKDTRPASECVTQVIPLKYVSAAQLVPILRPMLPQYAHLVALPSANSLIVVDRFANVRRIEAVVKSLDTPENQPASKKEPER